MEYIKIRNWEKYQHYSQRNPPWIKLHNQILDDYEYGCLQDDSKLLLISLFLLASKTENRIPADPAWIKSKAMLKGKIDLSSLIKSNFIEQLPNNLQDDSGLIASRKQNGGTEESRGDKKRIDNKKAQAPDWLDLKLWDDFLEHRKKLKKPMTEKAKELFFSKLNKFKEQGFSPAELIETAIVSGWQTVYEPRDGNKTKPDVVREYMGLPG